MAQCRPQSEGGTLGRDTFAAGSAYIASTLATAEARSARRRRSTPARRRGGSGVLLLDAQGGAIDDASAGADVLHPPRHALLGADPELRRRAPRASRAPRTSSAAARTALGRVGNGQAYQNYPDADLTTWRTRLLRRQVRRPGRAQARARPLRLLRFPQAIGAVCH